MSACGACGRALPTSEDAPTIHGGSGSFHLGCAPPDLVVAASEEYRAIVRKGVRYFVEKYSSSVGEGGDLGARFLDLGRALESERARRGLP